ncbi:hypothetical protein [Pygmaiobacter massiliensis]|uniref:hypothetical protein n=1 Tax=Pygmaiobacter massiliensis TaxID=1917873 RepID=UPI000C7D9E7B|nr:hypothetical protein [Pygmaiobacter massiliensis]
MIKDVIKRIFCSHEWATRGASWKEDNQSACYDTTYIFECQKCGKKKSIYTSGIDCIKTPNKVYNELIKYEKYGGFGLPCCPAPPRTGSSIVKEESTWKD